MKRITIALSLLFSGLHAFAQEGNSYHVSRKDITNGYVVKKIWIKDYAVPKISISNISLIEGVTMPEEALPSNPNNFDVVLGKERKRPFILVRVPAYTHEGGIVKQLAGFNLQVTEKPKTVTTVARETKPTATTSPLASGTWYKIATADRGMIKVDYDFVKNKLGITGTINSTNVRVFGNGGIMLSENNAVARHEGLQEAAIIMNDGGDGIFGPGDNFVFYSTGIINWIPDGITKTFNHIKNLYTDKAHYFLNFEQAQGKRVTNDAGNPGAANVTVSTYNDYHLHEQDLYNPGKVGKIWWGEDFSTDANKVSSRSFNLDLGDVSQLDLRIQVGSKAEMSGSTFDIKLNGNTIATPVMSGTTTDESGTAVSRNVVVLNTPYNAAALSLQMDYYPSIAQGVGYLDFIEVNTRRALAMAGNSITFRDYNSVATGNVAAYQLNNANGNTQVWDVTDPNNPLRVNGSLNGSTYSFVQNADTLHQFAAVNDMNALPAPEFISTVANQNIQGSEQVDYVIVSHPDFLPAAERLAAFHRQRSNMRVLVVTPQQVYNEFSSGGQDISAIRDMMRMFYNRAGMDEAQMPRYLLLLGDASYDYKDRIANNTNFVPTFESAESFIGIQAFCNDDFFGFLDDNEDIEALNIANTLDAGVGRFPVKNLEEANALVNKIQRYKSPSSLGPWRLNNTLVADDEDEAGPHMEDGEVMDTTITRNSNIYNNNKIYQNAIPTVATPGGSRAPEANKSINDQIFKGTFAVNYNGHGNTLVLSHERILTQDDFNKWTNIDRLPFMVTATCDFGRFDEPSYVSSGERLFLKANGGVIAILTTTRLVYQYANRILNGDFLDAQFKHDNGRWNTFGDAFRIGKNQVYANAASTRDVITNFRKFALLGDPALEPNFPEYFIHTDSVIDVATGQAVTTIGALGEYAIKGSVADVNKSVLSNFNGTLSVTFYDKPRSVSVATKYRGQQIFKVRNNVVYKGKATVKDGHFSIAFIAPKDINYDMGKGKISLYAENGNTDAAGADTTFNVGGFSDNPVIESNPPIVKPYIGDSLFRNGGLTGSNTLLYVKLMDETGINVSGNAVGHDLTAVLDDDVANPFVLNDYYETAANTYKVGYVNFPLTNIAPGKHRLTVKAWDVNNNSGTGYVDFEVGDASTVQLQKLVNYPNPFSDVTHFRFEHNHPDEVMQAEIQVYDAAGRLITALKKSFQPTGSHSDEITWDGTGDNGAKISSGVYMYRLRITTAKGAETFAYQKLVFLRY